MSFLGPRAQDVDSSLTQNAAYQCGENEVFQQCGVGWQCEDYCGRGPNACAYCQPGCYCKPGYIRTGPEYDATCIPENQCPRIQDVGSSGIQETAYQCGKNEVFQQCGVGWQCEDYCGRGPNACAYCQPGCYCKPGYIRTGPEYDATCIPENQCSLIQDVGSSGIQETGYQCGENEIFDNCGVGMECEDYCGRGPNACAYCQPGCYCRPGYVRSGPEYDAICIPEDQCSLAQDVSSAFVENAAYLCGENEVYDRCGVGKQCEDYCGRGPNACAYCQPGCYCRPGYVRSGPESNAKCIPKNQCPRALDVSSFWTEGAACGENEVFNQCGVGKQCEDYCGRGPNACAYCQPGCYCKSGYIRSGPESNAKCIRKNQCPRALDASPSFAPGPGPSALDVSLSFAQDVQDTGPSALDGGPSFAQEPQGPSYNCRPDEVFDLCGVGPECENYCGRGASACDYCQPACYCKQGTIRAGASNRTRCIPDNKC
ncbi:hypothetical protein AVEN_147648-1 [Araneus ventricosus]|uniref:TIL domain-containing protein n=1 Tax=Araneus ventricosus TaxID=182803 RepID=A0A4Y2QRU4_ARAVE|nr:hypothetical protein AVEN_147648-1 [Araneus ventricosus]